MGVEIDRSLLPANGEKVAGETRRYAFPGVAARLPARGDRSGWPPCLRPRYIRPVTRAYLDHNATSPLRAPARAKLLEALDAGGNPSSVHAEGRAARALVETAREKVAALIGGGARNVVFTSGATEALNLALAPHWRGPQGAPARLLLSATEHVAALDGHGFGAAAEILPVDGDGLLDLAALDAALARADGPVLLCLQAANNETGVLQPVAAAAEKVHAAGGLVVCDAVQAVGRIPCSVRKRGADMLVVSSHKIGGPQGAGAFVLRDAALHCDRGLIRGGGQERGFRAGTENVAAIAGFGAAAEEAAAQQADEEARLAALRDQLEASVLQIAPDALIFGAGAPRLPQHLRLRHSRPAGGNGADGLRSGRYCALVGLGLFVRQGQALARAGGHGRFGRSRPRRPARQPRLDVDGCRMWPRLRSRWNILARIGRKTAV